MTYDVLVLADFYPPATRGGALRSLSEMIETSGGRCRFHVLTRDHDAWSGEPYEVESDTWITRGRARVQYVSKGRLTMRTIADAARETGARAIYMNSLFSMPAQLALWGRWLGRHRLPLLLGPSGELSPGKLRHKGLKKSVYLRLAEAAGLYRPVRFRAASALEVSDIRRRFPRAGVDLASNPRRRDIPSSLPERPSKREGEARLLFLSRIHATKNILHILETIEKVRGEIDLTIVGPQEDPPYWKKCVEKIATLPANVTVTYAGAVGPADVWSHYATSHLFIFPTVGENYGYVIEEALAVGTPVAIGPDTPWGPRLGGAGWVVPLEDRSGWVRAVQECVDMGPAEFAVMSAAAAAVPGEGGETLEDVLVRLIEGRRL